MEEQKTELAEEEMESSSEDGTPHPDLFSIELQLVIEDSIKDK